MKSVYTHPMLSGIMWDWVFFGCAAIFGITAIVLQKAVFVVGAIYAFCLALRLGKTISGREGIPVFMLVCLLYVVENTPLRSFTESMVFTLQALIMFRALLLELRNPALLWVIPIAIEFGINIYLVYTTIQNIPVNSSLEWLPRTPGRILAVVAGVQLWLNFKNSLKLKKSS